MVPAAGADVIVTMPFSRRGERRLMIIDDQTVTPREDPQADALIKACWDLGAAKDVKAVVAGATP